MQLCLFDSLSTLNNNPLVARMKHRIVFAILMSFTLSLIMSAWVTFVNIGAVPGFVSSWMHAWVLAWPAAGAIAFLCGPYLHKLAHRIAARF